MACVGEFRMVVHSCERKVGEAKLGLDPLSSALTTNNVTAEFKKSSHLHSISSCSLSDCFVSQPQWLTAATISIFRY
jgi:hypothetical protein